MKYYRLYLLDEGAQIEEFEFVKLQLEEAGIEDNIPIDKHSALFLVNKWNSMSDCWKYWI